MSNFENAINFRRYRNALKMQHNLEKIRQVLNSADGFGYTTKQLAAKVGLKQSTTQMYIEYLGYKIAENGKIFYENP